MSWNHFEYISGWLHFNDNSLAPVQGLKLCNVHYAVKTKYVSVLSIAIKIVGTCTYVLPPVLGFTTLKGLHEYGRVYNYNFFLSLFLQVQHYTYIFLVKFISRTWVMLEEIFIFRFFSSLGFFRGTA